MIAIGDWGARCVGLERPRPLRNSVTRIPEPAAPPVVDVDAFLARVQGDTGLASGMAALFLLECPQQLADVRAAVTARDRGAIERSAHRLKGSVANFSAAAATAAAAHVELLGRTGDLAPSDEALRTLEVEIERIIPALREFIA